MRKLRQRIGLAAAASIAGLAMAASPAQAQERYIGEILQTGATFCPRDTAELNGQLLPIATNDALFALIGTIYGGDGRATFGLPDLRGRVPMHAGQGPGLSSRRVGQRFGSEENFISITNMPAHTHNERMRVSRVNATTRNPIGAYLARSADNVFEEVQEPTTGDTMASDAISSQNVGGNLPVSNIQPVLVNRYCMVLGGIFPSRS